MGGQAGGRGYLFQSLICVLDIVRSDHDWRQVTIEPNMDSEKVDILWTFDENKQTAIQIKSSENQINKSSVEAWARELEESTVATEYELILVGPCSDSVANMRRFGRVSIPPPHALNIRALIEQAAHRMDRYFDSRGIMRVPPFVRELLVEGLVTRISTYASHGTPLQPIDLDRLLNEWVLSLYPEAVTQAVEMQCTAVWNTIYVPTGTTHGLIRKSFIAPVTFVNDGIRTSIIKSLRVVLSPDGKRCLYKPSVLVNLKRLISDRAIFQAAYHDGVFSEFAVPRGQVKEAEILFDPCLIETWDQNSWEPGAYGVELFAAFADREPYVSLRRGFLDVGRADVDDIVHHRQSILRFREPDLEF